MAKTLATSAPTLTLDGKDLILRIPAYAQPKLSASGKNKLVASTNGNMRTELVIDGKPVTIGFNAYIPA